jgi:hypothetical protein
LHNWDENEDKVPEEKVLKPSDIRHSWNIIVALYLQIDCVEEVGNAKGCSGWSSVLIDPKSYVGENDQND